MPELLCLVRDFRTGGNAGSVDSHVRDAETSILDPSGNDGFSVRDGCSSTELACRESGEQTSNPAQILTS